MERLRAKFGHGVVLIDYETTCLAPVSARITRATVLSGSTGRVHVYRECDVELMATELDRATVIVAHNCEYELEVSVKYVGEERVDLWRSKVFDLFTVIRDSGLGYVSLGTLCAANRPRMVKTGKGGDAIGMWDRGEMEALEDYNIMDVLSMGWLVVEPELQFCVHTYVCDVGSVVHLGKATFDTRTLRFSFDPGEFPEGMDLDSCTCATRFQEDVRAGICESNRRRAR